MDGVASVVPLVIGEPIDGCRVVGEAFAFVGGMIGSHVGNVLMGGVKRSGEG